MVRRLLALFVLLTLLGALAPAAAQSQSAPMSPVARALTRYLLNANELPPGVRLVAGPIEITNEDVAAADPDNAELIYRHGRLVELAQVARRAQGSGSIVVSAILFRDAEGAWGDALDSTFGNFAEVERTLPGPDVGERSVLFRFVRGIAPNQTEGYTLVFQRDRLELAVAVEGLLGEVDVEEILPVARAVDAKVMAAPPGPLTTEQEALLEEPTPSVLVRGAVRLLLDWFYQPLEVDVLLKEAWEGAARALRRAGVSAVPPPPEYPRDEAAAITMHLRFFPALERLAEGRLSQHQLAYAALAELVERRQDCHTSHLSRLRWEIFKARQRGEPAVQLGVSFAIERPLRIVSVLPNSPAEHAGLRFGQEVVAINGQPLTEFSVTEARALIDPREGVPTTFTVRNPSGHIEEISVAPASFALPPMESRILPGKIGYLTFYQFQSTAEQLDLMRRTLDDWEAEGVIGWIIDLRRNSGGSGALMTAMMSLFVDGGRLYADVERDSDPVFINASRAYTLPFQRPLVFLIGPGSASAAEIMPGALQARGRAVLVGETTAGCIGSFIPRGLLDGSSFNPTVSEVLIGPDRLRLHRIGVSPNVPAPLTPADAEAGRDPGLPAAVRVIEELTGVPAASTPDPQQAAPRTQARIEDF